MKLPVTIKGSSKQSPQMVERQREINQEVNARYQQLVGGHVGGKAAQDAAESELKAHEIVERHRHRVLALSEEYNKLKLRAERKEERAKELHFVVTLEASAGGLRAPMTDHELELILEDRKLLQQHHSPSKGGGGGALASVSEVAIFAGHAAVHRAIVAESSSAQLDSTDAENFSHREDLRAKLTERDESFEEERRIMGTYNLIASRLVRSKKEEAARNAQLGEVMASRDAQVERLKADLMLQDKMTKKVMDDLRSRQETLMGRRRAWEERRQELLDIVEEAVSKSNSDELRDAVNLRNVAFENRVGKLGINLKDLKPEEKPKVSVTVARLRGSSATRAAAKNAKEGGGGGGGGGGGAGGKAAKGGKERKSGKDAGAVTDAKKQPRGRAAEGTGGGVAGENHDRQREQQQPATHGAAEEEAEPTAGAADDAGGRAKARVKGGGGGGGGGGIEGVSYGQTVRGGGGGGAEDDEDENHRSASPELIAAGDVGLAQYKREAKKMQTQRRLAIQLELEQEKESEKTEKEEAEKEQGDVRELLKRDAENRVLSERERMRKERLAEIEAKSLSRTVDYVAQKTAHGLVGGGEITDQGSKMEKLFGLITRSLGMPESTDATIVADTIADLAQEQRRKEREGAESARRAEAEEAGEAATAAAAGEEDAKANAGDGVAVVAGLATAQINANRAEKEAVLREKRKQLAAYRAEVQARLTAKANEISGGGLASVKDVVNLEEKIETTATQTGRTKTRVATSSRIAKNASMGINELYALLRRKGRVWRASDIFGKPDATWDDADPLRSSSQLSGDPSPPAAAAAAAALEGRPPASIHYLKTNYPYFDDDWDLDSDPKADVHPGPPLADGEGDTSADDGGMLEMNLARLVDFAASLVAMTRAVRVDGGADPATSFVGGGDGAGRGADASPSSSRRTSARRVDGDDNYGGGGGGGRSDGDGVYGGGGGDGGVGDRAGKEHAEAATGNVSLERSSSTMKQMKHVLSLQENFKAVSEAEFRRLKMNFEVDSSSSDDDDVQAGGRARVITSADSDDSDDDLCSPGTEGPHGGRLGAAGGGARGALSGGGRGRTGERGMPGIMSRAKKSSSSSSSSEREDKSKPPRHSRGDATSSASTELPATPGPRMSSSASLHYLKTKYPHTQETSSTGAAATTAAPAADSSSSMPKISKSYPASGKTPIRASNLGGERTKKSVTTADEKVTSVTGGKDLYSGKVKKMAGDPERPTGPFDSQPNSGSRSISADRPLPV